MWWWSHLSPQQLAHADEHAPQPLVDGQSRAGEGLPSKLDDDDLRRKTDTGRVGCVSSDGPEVPA